MLTFALLLSAGMGIIQEKLYKEYGKYPDEALYYNVIDSNLLTLLNQCWEIIFYSVWKLKHVLTLPAFAFLYKDIINHIDLFNQSRKFYSFLVSLLWIQKSANLKNVFFYLFIIISEMTTFLTISLPIMWWYLIGNTLTQYVCISSVFVLTTECPSLTVTLVLTLRKFVSLIISILYFQNSFTHWHWIGALLVFAGTLMFTNFIKKFFDYLTTEAKQEESKKAQWIKLYSKKTNKHCIFLFFYRVKK